ncbi:MAG TPA: ferritin-like domain-containing protein [Pyrinomonadaceae bacterium]|jgi:hypothetical protein
MPAPEFSWIKYEVEVSSDSPLRELTAFPSPSGLALVDAVTTDTATIQLPDLRAWSSPSDKAEILLETAAEIEHALMVQYLYAAYSLKSGEEVSNPDEQAVLDQESGDSWYHVLLGIAREEMGHLMTVQNLLLLLGLPPNLEREDFPTRKQLYPFPLQLERLTQTSLAKYVVAEAPIDATDIDGIIKMAQGAAGTTINHVGIIYGLLGLVFATEENVQAGGSGSTHWDEMVRDIARAAYQQAPQADWHLPEGAFNSNTPEQQADPSDWENGGQLRVHKLTDRLSARQAIRDIGEQGEGPTNQGAQSHFERFRSIYRGREGFIPFPAAGKWTPTREVPTNPKLGIDIVEPRTKRWAELADIRYALLLGFVEHYLLTSGGNRNLLTGWIFTEMRSRLGFIARRLTTMPRGGVEGAVAGAPFSLPARLHLPGAETARWTLHKERTEAAIAKIEEMRAADEGDKTEAYLNHLLASDKSRLAFIMTRTGTKETTTSFVRDILPLFRPKDIQHMIEMVDLNLTEYEVVKSKADKILNLVQRPLESPKRMPPPPDEKWTQAQVDLFMKWRDEEFPN